jgi:hypothetical protein
MKRQKKLLLFRNCFKQHQDLCLIIRERRDNGFAVVEDQFGVLEYSIIEQKPASAIKIINTNQY